MQNGPVATEDHTESLQSNFFGFHIPSIPGKFPYLEVVKTLGKAQIPLISQEDVDCSMHSHNMIDLKKLSANPNGENMMNG